MKNNKRKKEKGKNWREIKSKKNLSNNIIALLAVLFIISSVFFNFSIYRNARSLTRLTGKYLGHNIIDTASISFCIGSEPPIVGIIYPNGFEIINGIIDVEAVAVKKSKYEDINTSFYYANNINGKWIFIGNDTDESDNYYNASWDTTNVADGNCVYTIFAKAYSDESVCGGTFGVDGSDFSFSINNIDVEPRWDNFKNNLTTNFSEFEDPLQLGDWTTIENATIGIPNKGLINFSNQIINFDDADLDSNINISYNHISLNPYSNALPCLNMPAILTLNGISVLAPKIMINGENCSIPQCKILNHSNGNLIFEVLNFQYVYSAAENASLNLDISDETDNIIKYINENVTFFANLSDNVYGNPVNGTSVYCKIKFKLTDNYGESTAMEFNHSSLLYEYTRPFNVIGKFDYSVFCNSSKTSEIFLNNYSLDGIRNKTSDFTITNRLPVLISLMPNETWNEDSILTGRDLDDYFMDPDGEELTYTYSGITNIDVSIDNITHIITYTPNANFYGNRTIRFYAHDSHNGNAESNIIYLFVIDVPEEVPTPSSSGGGGGGATLNCRELWECSKFGKCFPSGIQTRICTDLADCGTNFKKPFETRECKYVGTCFDLIKNCHHGSCEIGVDCGGPCPACPSCSDGIQNQGEEGVDCGGPCPVCLTCFDGIHNQGEEGVDCGGPCPACPSCSDGIQNQGEEDVDCGGPCPACQHIEMPAVVKKVVWPTISLIGILILAVMFIIVRYHKYYQPLLTKVLMKLIPLFALVKKKKKVIPEGSKVRESILLRLDNLENSINKKFIEELSRELIRIVRDFLSDLLKIDYEFTYEELCKEIEKHEISTPLRIIIITFFKKISEISYKGYKMKKPELKELISEARIIVKFGSEEYLDGRTEKKGFKEKGLKEKRNIKKESKLMLDIYKDLIKAKKSIRESDMDSAKLAYIRIKEFYKELPVKEKKKIYKKIVLLYNQIKEENLDKVKTN